MEKNQTMKTAEDFLPWAMPNETVEAIEIMEESAAIIRNVAQFASLRKELRDQLINQAIKLEQMASMINGGIVDEALILGIDSIAQKKKTLPMSEIMEALETHISNFNRRKS